MEVVIVGLPLSGKTTLFNALTRGATGTRDGVPVGTTKIPDARVDRLAEMYHPKKVTHAELAYWDPPPAREGARSKGVGGSQLNLLQRADALVGTVRAFDDPMVPQPAGGVDPHRDVQALLGELAFSDLLILEKRVERIQAGLKGAKAHERDQLLREQALLAPIKGELEKDVPIRQQQVKEEDKPLLANYQFLTAKPLVLAFNVGEGDLAKGKQLEADFAKRYESPGVKALVVCARVEAELAQFSPEEEKEFRATMGAEGFEVGRIAKACQDLQGLASFLTCGEDEVRAWMIPAGLPAVKAAGKIHSDLERGFIRAEVVRFEDLMACGSMDEARKRGLLRLEGKTYPVKDGDIMEIRFSVPNPRTSGSHMSP